MPSYPPPPPYLPPFKPYARPPHRRPVLLPTPPGPPPFQPLWKRFLTRHWPANCRPALLPTPPYPPPFLPDRPRPWPAHGRSRLAPLRSHPHQLPCQPPPPRHPLFNTSHPPPAPNDPPTNPPAPSVLVVGSSMVRHVTMPKAETHSFSGAKVLDINTRIPELTADRPQIFTVIIHIGANDIKLKQSEVLKQHFRTLISTISATGKAFIISGPFPSPRYTHTQFSRIRDLHIWLQGHCTAKGIPYTNNFTTFWTQPDLFAKDGLHLNQAGARLLSLSMELTLESLSWSQEA